MKIIILLGALWMGLFSPMASAITGGIPITDPAALIQRIEQIAAMAKELQVLKEQLLEMDQQTLLQNLELDSQTGLHDFFNKTGGMYGGVKLPPDMTDALNDIGIKLPKKCANNSAWDAQTDFERDLEDAATERFRIDVLKANISRRYTQIETLALQQTRAVTAKQSADLANRLAVERSYLTNETNELAALELSFKAREREEALKVKLDAWKERNAPLRWEQHKQDDICY